MIIGSSDSERYFIEQTFSPIPPPYVIRWFLAYLRYHKFALFQIDIKTSFLYSYAFVPEGSKLDSNKFILKLQKVAHGLAISPLLWFQIYLHRS